MKKICIIQFRKGDACLEKERDAFLRVIGDHGVSTFFISALDDAHPWNDPGVIAASYDAIILGGSGDFDFDGGRVPRDEACVMSREIAARMRPLVMHAIEYDMPLLGICFGHQLIAEVLGCKVVHDDTQTKIGSFEVFLTEEGKSDPLFGRLPERFIAHYGHKDSLSGVPECATLLACGPQCKTSALRFGAHVYSVQFHPELTRSDVDECAPVDFGYLPSGIEREGSARGGIDASVIIPYFLTWVV